jgi:hypothetical protein
MVMKKISRRNDWWDWCVILLFVAAGTLVLWASVWVAHSYAADGHHPTATSAKPTPTFPLAGSTADVRPSRCMERQN